MERTYPPQPPEGRLIEEAARVDGRPIRQLAPLAGLSDARWRHITKGYQPTGGGRYNEARAPAATLARMALVLGLDPDDLDKVGRSDAGVILADMQAAKERRPSPVPQPPTVRAGKAGSDPIDLIYRSTTMTDAEKIDAITKLMELRNRVEQSEAAPDHGDVQARPLEQNH